ncbi:DUF262 domain-containing protein [Natronorubrum sp. FCH18a]|uniref:DUF262 domain-containing protein n=1 Tax=Natronorubrum sp. FCH18a TaxID=3447018 RepID=UPI003F50E444
MERVWFDQKSATVGELVTRLATDEDEPEEPIYIPSLQREFCWSHPQIEDLFDSVLRGLPIGALLFWHVDGETAETEATYRFIKHYVEESAYPTEKKHERDERWVRNKSDRLSDDEPTPGDYTFALDGQQRLTSFLIGLRGTHYRHKSQQWKSKLNSYSERQLYLDVLSDPEEQDGIDDDHRYRFKFQTSGENRTEDDAYWWPVPRVWELESITEEIDELQASIARSSDEKAAIKRNLNRLHEAMFVDEHLVIEYVSDMDSEVALDLFVRRNDGGEPLSNSDIAFSQMAVYWKSEDEDPKEAIESYVDDLEQRFGEYGFGFGKGFLLRTLLMLAGHPPSFRRENLIPDNIRDLEDVWNSDAFDKAMDEAYRIVTEELGYGRKCLTSNSAMLPIVYYCYQNLAEEPAESVHPTSPIRDRMDYWLCITVCNNLFTIGSDTVLRKAQDHIDANSFPILEILENFRGRGIELELDEDRLQTLVEETDYRSGSVKHLLLTKSYTDDRISGVLVNGTSGEETDEANQVQVDHIFPRNKLNDDQALLDRGLGETEVDVCKRDQHRLGNLQLIPENQSKGDDDPDDWIRDVCDNGMTTEEVATTHCLPWDDVEQFQYDRFEEFCNEREERLFDRLTDSLTLHGDIAET